MTSKAHVCRDPIGKTCQRLTLAEIQLATNYFDEALLIGSGGFSKVYKSLNKFGSVNEVAIKKLNSTPGQGAREFEAEVKLLSKLCHANLVSLIGYCCEGNEMVLAYEFMPKGTLADHIHKGDTELSWLRLLKILIGAACGLHYLHTGTSTKRRVIHRDVKPSNILLDAEFEAKIADFGLVKVGTKHPTGTIVSISGNFKGTFGYMDPCYCQNGQLTTSSDVYAFGVVLFEVLSGKPAVDQTLTKYQQSLAVWAKAHVKEQRLDKIVSHRLIGQISKKCLKEFTSIAVECLHEEPTKRPTMAQVVGKLESILSQERERASSGVNDGKFFNKVRDFFAGKASLMPAHAEGSKSKITAPKPKNQSLRIFTHDESVTAADNCSHYLRIFTYPELEIATYNCNSKKFSQHSLETIYKGWVDEKTYAPTRPGVGLPMYVRTRLIGTSKLDLKPEEFIHPNLVKLFGYYLNEQRLSCVYELVPGTSLHELLFGETGTTSLSWVARLKIAVGAAQGLSFVHNKGRPAYRQFQTSCILVDKNYNPRLRDFEVNNSFLDCDSYTFEMGVHYASPEWYRHVADVSKLVGHYSNDFALKNEIYSFGVVLLEILTGMKVFDRNRPEGRHNLLNWAAPLLADEKNLAKIVDAQLQDDNHPPKAAFMFAEVVLDCLQPQDERPPMEKILQGLARVLSRTVRLLKGKHDQIDQSSTILGVR